MRTDDERWLRRFHTPRRASAPPLVICPHAGTGASAYQPFSRAFGATHAVTVLQYPGRQDRADEAAATTVPELAGRALDAYAAAPGTADRPVTVFGHSMGGVVAFEFARAAEAAGIPVALLVVSAVVPAGRVADQPEHPSDDDAIVDRLVALNGTSAEVLASRDIMRMALPALKADYAAVDAYSCPATATVDAPILALGGDADPIVTPGDLYGWAAHTTGGLSVTLFAGGHFYLNDDVDLVAGAVADAVPAVR
ncbi:thioesterase II family protein [Pseudonocardia endophytica]|uniref:Surfactin synthase thioesterase subunit n=1 Tax=Pseudonocardia endophytica TaxID=401976 RepID=A0A4R1HTE4_PSEEN|nr:alpha/beta fold hydrolase [Pseudonocardia endophytica]TCK24583.1 surfactin synthase thioesterase subunit [Pseudonocardia endophytica]